MEHRGIHRLRHTSITTLAEGDVHERTAQHLDGHEDGRMTREIYTQATRRMLDIATETITKAIGDIAGQASGSPGAAAI